MRIIFLSLTFLSTFAFANVLTELNTEFSRRDAIKLTSAQGAVVNYLRAIKFPLVSIQELVALEDANQSFLLRDKFDIICFGQMSLQNLRCKTALGITSQEFNAEEMDVSLLKSSESSTSTEFVQRNDKVFDSHTAAIIKFLNTIKFPTDTIVELEPMKDLSESFFIRDRSNMVCFGSAVGEMLRCKNEIGITGVTYTGDSD